MVKASAIANLEPQAGFANAATGRVRWKWQYLFLHDNREPWHPSHSKVTVRSGALLTGHTTGNRTVNFTCQPIATSNSLKLQYLLDIFFNFIFTIFNIGEMFSLVLSSITVFGDYRTYPSSPNRLASHRFWHPQTRNDDLRGLPRLRTSEPVPISHTPQCLHILCLHYEAHPFLGLISHDLFVGKSRITDR